MNRNIFLDGIFGVVTGDALGDSVQFMSREEVIRRGLVTSSIIFCFHPFI